MRDAILVEVKIEGIAFHQIRTFSDNRGFFREVARMDLPLFEEGFARKFHASLALGKAPLWMCHPTETAWFYVPTGAVSLQLRDLREKSSTFGVQIQYELSGAEQASVIKIPAGVAYSFEALNASCAEIIQLVGANYSHKNLKYFPFEKSH
ncbi:MAG: dTDP-4-dehydrorhamnose 3,5-epimerase family protein [Chloroflexi bacterium]|uniref:dTDP-4-dehydrorhamnose 3,5-epimerase family protein n=1 Tax=Candidatus Chlorohelix allophototropha TaxID=3003348 RepID=A0A8T7LWH2_9CHLR|nr:dTDP-4-dehydrorhamnose 3,5-epimerase family protein [Chloroflexota bacterium]WJW67093.1 dTDP-4-dehydrorhamnose 3,5-epimerase family protein [Chloroflexota bacterium L227-S17]